MSKILITCKKIKKSTKYIINEYNRIISLYDEDDIIQKSICIRCKIENEDYNKIIKNYFIPILEIMSNMINDGIIEWESSIEEVNLNSISKDSNNLSKLIEESWERLYIFKSIKYDLTLNFIMHLYINLEKEFLSFINKEYNCDKKTLFSSLKFIEKKENIIIEKELKNKLNLYRNIINVHKHGKGESFDYILSNNLNILNNNGVDGNFSFIFNFKKINIFDLCDAINKLLDLIENQIKINL